MLEEEYRFLRLIDNKCYTFLCPRRTALFGLGWDIRDYLVIKTDYKGCRLVVPEHPELHLLVKQLEEA